MAPGNVTGFMQFERPFFLFHSSCDYNEFDSHDLGHDLGHDTQPSASPVKIDDQLPTADSAPFNVPLPMCPFLCAPFRSSG